MLNCKLLFQCIKGNNIIVILKTKNWGKVIKTSLNLEELAFENHVAQNIIKIMSEYKL